MDQTNIATAQVNDDFTLDNLLESPSSDLIGGRQQPQRKDYESDSSLSVDDHRRFLSDVDESDDGSVYGEEKQSQSTQSSFGLPLSPPQLTWYTPPRYNTNNNASSNLISRRRLSPSYGVVPTKTSPTLIESSVSASSSIDTGHSDIYFTPHRKSFARVTICSSPLVGSLTGRPPLPPLHSTMTTTAAITMTSETNTSLTETFPANISELKTKDGIHENDTLRFSKFQKQRIPVVSIVEGIRCKAPINLSTLTKLLLTLDGRDKFTKLLQYICRLLAWWLSATKNTKGSVFLLSERFAALKASLTSSRKAFRLGRSFIEIHKLQSIGLIEWIDHCLQSHCGEAVVTKTLCQSISNVAYCMYHPFAQRISNVTSKTNTSVPLWSLIGNTVKILGLLSFWAADNVSFLAQSGFFDDYSKVTKQRLHDRARYATSASIVANRSYFIGAIAGLVTNWKIYWDFTTKSLQALVLEDSLSTTSEMSVQTKKALQKGQEKQFTLFVALLKSLCDVLVFSNNPGIELWKRYLGHPMHEGFHCICGIASASSVLYANFPVSSV